LSDSPFRSGFVCILGRPNVGKSTLVNRLVGAEVTIATPKPQTTRTRVLGVLHGEGWQAVLVDTPGVHEARDPLNARMVGYAAAALNEADLVLMIVEPFGAGQREPGRLDRRVQEMVDGAATPALLLINKIDLADESRVLPTIDWYRRTGRFAEIVPVSALKGKGMETLQKLIAARLPEGPPYFELDQRSDQSGAALAAELVRKALFQRTGQEIPYSSAVRLERMEEQDGLLHIHATIFVERDSQKGIVIGKGGAMLRAIGQDARRRIEALFGKRVYLQLHVAVLKDWSRDPRALGELGYPEE
jgi:GTP-binding protein Era